MHGSMKFMVNLLETETLHPISMASSKLLVCTCIFHILFTTSSIIHAAPTNSKLFREYIGADGNNIRFSDVPINPNVDFHFILSFAIDYTNTASPTPTNGDFSAFWDTNNLSPSQVSSIKAHHPNVKVAMSLGGDTVNNHPVFFSPWLCLSLLSSITFNHKIENHVPRDSCRSIPSFPARDFHLEQLQMQKQEIEHSEKKDLLQSIILIDS